MRDGKGRILVVENEATIRELLQLILSAEGYDVMQASDGSEALGMTALQRPDLILLDIRMPDVDGYEFARRYRGGVGPHAPIVVLTAAPTDKVADQLEACAYLGKPFELDQLLEAVATCRDRGALSN